MNLLKNVFIVLFLATLFVSCSQDDEVISEPFTVEKIDIEDTQIENRDGDPCDYCNCDALVSLILTATVQCERFRQDACEELRRLQAELRQCRNRQPICPPGFTFDECNCSAGVSIPEGYEYFMYEFADGTTHLYVQQNCDSTENDCCPEGWEFDGANCRNPNVTIPQGFTEWFTYQHADGTTHFYVVPLCGE